MYYNIAKLVYDYTINNKNVDEKFVGKVASIIAQERQLNNLISDLEITRNKGLSAYNINTNDLIIDIYESKSFFDKLSVNNKVLIHNLEILNIIFHEFDHILLKKEELSGKKEIDILLVNLIKKEKKKQADRLL